MRTIKQVDADLEAIQAELHETVQHSYPVGCEVRFSTHSSRIKAKVVGHRLYGDVRIENILTGKSRWVSGTSEELERVR